MSNDVSPRSAAGATRTRARSAHVRPPLIAADVRVGTLLQQHRCRLELLVMQCDEQRGPAGRAAEALGAAVREVGIRAQGDQRRNDLRAIGCLAPALMGREAMPAPCGPIERGRALVIRRVDIRARPPRAEGSPALPRKLHNW